MFLSGCLIFSLLASFGELRDALPNALLSPLCVFRGPLQSLQMSVPAFYSFYCFQLYLNELLSPMNLILCFADG